MDKLQVIQRAKSYMDMLAKGIDPISGELVENDSTLQQERLQKCFSFVSEILDEIIKTNGIVTLPATEFSQGYVVVKKKAVFSINKQQRSGIRITSNPILPSFFLKNINSVVDTETMEKLSLTTVNKWLLQREYLSESKVPTVINKTVKIVTPLSAQIGIIEQTVVDSKTGEAKQQILFSRQAQEFILDNIKSIIA
ncbi:MAG: hypothetical protein NC122_01245 [Faecalibacterium sp.]|nr:hypothetical protein [Ruminococcus sp.]MCM1393000.1 hypothetical protein [Ruminococcus sp.]MCM1484814.1 hypothetical protein [Faecalibacterium sp.]